MKRIINMDNQIMEGRREFAIWCTVVDRFETVYDSQSWASADELARDFDLEIAEQRSPGLVANKERCVLLARSAGY